MDFIDRIRDLASQIPKQLDYIHTEEATKNALIMPFINALGYNVFDPTQVIPEYVADYGTKKGEKIDYAIMKDGKPIMLFECKTCGIDLSTAHISQLYRYFSVTGVRFGILTNGLAYHFYSDLEKPNQMDEKPFLVFDMLSFDERMALELKKFTRDAFDVDHIVSTASELKYGREIRQIIEEQFNNPSEDFVRLFAGRVYSGRLTQSVIEAFTGITKQALRAYVNKEIQSRLQSALAKETEVPQEDVDETEVPVEDRISDIVTTDEERDGYLIVKAILREIVDVQRITMRDAKSYCGILLDNNNRKPICRLHFNREQKYIGLFDEQKNEDRVPIETVDDIYKYADRLRAAISYYVE